MDTIVPVNRSDIRLKKHLDVQLRTGAKESIVGRTRDISRYGLCVETEREMPPEELSRLMIRLDDHFVPLTGLIRWTRRKDGDFRAGLELDVVGSAYPAFVERTFRQWYPELNHLLPVAVRPANGDAEVGVDIPGTVRYGLTCSSPLGMPVGERVELTVTLPAPMRRLVIAGRAVWSRECENGGYKVGVDGWCQLPGNGLDLAKLLFEPASLPQNNSTGNRWLVDPGV